MRSKWQSEKSMCIDYELETNGGRYDDTFDRKGNLLVDRVKENRNPNWQPIDYGKLDKIFGKLSRFEYLMAENQCKDTETAIKAITNHRNDNDTPLYYILKGDMLEDEARNHYLRKSMNDIEDDKEKYYQ